MARLIKTINESMGDKKIKARIYLEKRESIWRRGHAMQYWDEYIVRFLKKDFRGAWVEIKISEYHTDNKQDAIAIATDVVDKLQWESK